MTYTPTTPRPTGTNEVVATPRSAAPTARPLATHASSASSFTIYMNRDNSTATAASVFLYWSI